VHGFVGFKTDINHLMIGLVTSDSNSDLVNPPAEYFADFDAYNPVYQGRVDFVFASPRE
jgi:hypothetical protein